ncbi:lanthionine synthetase LanC family protein [Longispora sp. K20-0274]|uniref:lanthionine synthetase LanC family protein n=1 Tax=Longispora sp. K20-0274 TaxID=3088255 RepID=UPI00399C3C2D
MGGATHAELLGRQGLDWLLGQARETETGLGWTVSPADDEVVHSLYQGTAGVVPALLEGWRHFDDDRYADAALRAARSLAAGIDTCEDSSLHNGLAGTAVVLRGVGRLLGDEASASAADRALGLVRARFDGTRWSDLFELMFGNAGIAVGALACGDTELAVLAVEPYVRTAEPTTHGCQWQHRPGVDSRLHHISHGTLGIVHALAAVGHAAGRPDLVDLALAGAADVVARDEAGPEGFLVPHSDPQYRPELIPRYSYGWCHGPTGDARVFGTLATATGDPRWTLLADRCWHTVTRSGLPQRLRPGFWDNNGRCCGTAGVLALACDRVAERGEPTDFADVLVADLAARATVDGDGARWSNHEHRETPSELPPRTGWAMGNAGIVPELLRYARLGTGSEGYALALP